MKSEAQEAAQAGRAGGGDPEVGLSRPGGRRPEIGGRSPDQPLACRLKRSVELFPASDGSLYLLRLGAGDEFVLSAPSEEDRALLFRLGEGFATFSELKLALEHQGLCPAGLPQTLADLQASELLECSDGRQRLSTEEAERYDRQLIYFADLVSAGEEAEDLQLRLRHATVALVGCGGLGCWVACGLSGAGVGHLILIDDDRVELSNLNRQLLFTEAQLGQHKIDAAANSLQAHNRAVRVSRVRRRVQGPDDLADVLEQEVDLVVSTGDWPPHHLPRWVNDVCMERGIPWIGAGQFPPRLRVGPLVVPGESPCLECLEAAARRDHPLYDELGEWRARGQTPDASVGPVSAVIGALIASEVIHFLTNAFRPASVGAALLLDLRSMELEREEIDADADCPACTRHSVRPTSDRPRLTIPNLIWQP